MAFKYFLVGLLFCLLVNLGSSELDKDKGIAEDVPAERTDPPATESPNEDVTNTTLAPNTTPVKPNTTTSTTTVAPKTTTVEPNTTTVSPNTTTVAPNTTTVAPNTTTVAPDTTTVAPNTTTIAPNTTTVAPSTTTAPPAPTPLPDPEMGSWILQNPVDNMTCAVIHMALRLKVPYTASENKTEWALFNLPKTANLTGKCDNGSMEFNVTDIILSWDNNVNSLQIRFLRNDDKKTFNVSEVVLMQNTTGNAFVNSTVNKRLSFVSNGSGLFSYEYVPLGNSYKCSHKVNLNMTNEEDSNSTNAVLVFSKMQIQAFMNSTSSAGFGSVVECPGLDASDIVPIAVGCALAGLVIGVLIAYLVGRRRSHARGYLSM